MPLLKREPDYWPDDLFEMDMQWCVVHVRSRQEKALARDLRGARIPHYVPQIEKCVQRSGRTYRSYLPVLGGYVFARVDGASRLTVVANSATVRILNVDDQVLLRAELLALRRLLESGATLSVVNDVAPGDTVIVKEGPFRGYGGIVRREARGSRFFVLITALRITVEIEFDARVLERDAAPLGAVHRRRQQAASRSDTNVER